MKTMITQQAPKPTIAILQYGDGAMDLDIMEVVAADRYEAHWYWYPREVWPAAAFEIECKDLKPFYDYLMIIMS